MAFFFNESKKAPAKKAAKSPARRGVIPIASLQELGCSVCPRNDATDLDSPKLKPSGVESPDIYLLGSQPSFEDDRNNNHWTSKAGDYLYKTFGNRAMSKQVRSNYITQCAGPQTEIEIACCRNRIVKDIEESKPSVIVTIGDGPLAWVLAGDRANALVSTGTWIATKVGKHSCWVVPLIEPRFLEKKGYGGPDGHQLMLEHVVTEIKRTAGAISPPKVWDSNLKDGLTLITGEAPNDFGKLERALERLLSLGNVPISIDIETNGLRPRILENPKIITVAVGTFDDTVAFALDHPEGWGSDFQRKRVWGLLIAFLTRCGPRVAHNVGFEMEWLEFFMGAKILREFEWEDTMAQCHTLDERPGTKSLDYQCRINFGFWLKSLSNLDAKRLLDYPLIKVLEYNALDVKWDHKLFTTLRPVIEATPAYLLEYERKVRLAPTLVLTQAHGVLADVKEAGRHFDLMEEQLAKLSRQISRTPEVKIYEQRFGHFSPTAPDQVLKLMRDVCLRPEVSVADRDGSTRGTTNEAALSSIPVGEVPSAGLILEHRGLSKLTGTYLVPVISRKILSASNLVHCQYGSMVAVTGRLNSEDPNLQNWPKRKHKQIRSIFVPRPGHVYGACDYGQIEFRVVGMASEDQNLVKACWTGYDVHKFWAERIVALYPRIKDQIAKEFKVDWEESGLKLLRQESKNKWVFPQLFGASTKSCVEGLAIPSDVGDELAGEFWDEFRQVKRWQEKLLKSYERNLYVETLSGRRRRGAMTKNEIINMPIQGTAADLVTAGMVAVSERGYAEDDPCLIPAFNVHDDLTFEWPEDPVLMLQKQTTVVEEMCRIRFDWVNVPLMVEVATGPNWADLKEIGKFTSTEVFGLQNPYA